jgi:hypothetical protein
MKIGAVSDIHADINSKRGEPGFIDELVRFLEGPGLDVLIIPGDAAGSVNSLIDFFNRCGDLPIPHKIYLPGNHDVWTGGKIPDGSWVKYRKVLPEICNELNWTYLPRNPLVIEGTAIFGSMGWYDYSTANSMWDGMFSEEEYMLKVNPNNAKWMDVEYAHFNMSDREVAGELLREAEEDLVQLGFSAGEGNGEFRLDDEGIKTVVFVSHLVPYMDFINFRNDPSWDFFGAYIGNINIGKFLDRLPRNLRRLAFFGHTHFPGAKVVESGVEGYCVPLGYPDEYGSGRLEDVFRERIRVVEV